MSMYLWTLTISRPFATTCSTHLHLQNRERENWTLGADSRQRIVTPLTAASPQGVLENAQKPPRQLQLQLRRRQQGWVFLLLLPPGRMALLSYGFVGKVKSCLSL